MSPLPLWFRRLWDNPAGPEVTLHLFSEPSMNCILFLGLTWTNAEAFLLYPPLFQIERYQLFKSVDISALLFLPFQSKALNLFKSVNWERRALMHADSTRSIASPLVGRG